MTIEELLAWPDRGSLAAMPESDALTEVDALVEAALLDARVNSTTSSAWLLFDCRGALQLRMGNTAVVAISGVTRLQWLAEPTTPRVWRAVAGWRPVVFGDEFVCTVDLFMNDSFQVAGSGAEFYVGDVPGCDGPPPDFMRASDAEIRAGLASWTSEFDVVHASFLRSAERGEWS